MRPFLSVVLGGAVIGIGFGWVPARAQPAPVVVNANEKFVIELGQKSNVFEIDKQLYLGATVDQFRVAFRFANTWPSGVTVRFFDRNGLQVATYRQKDAPAGGGALWTPQIQGNLARIQISSGATFATFASHRESLILQDIEATVVSGRAATFADAVPLVPGVEAIGYNVSPLVGANVFYLDGASVPVRYSVYLSPYDQNAHHDVKARARWTFAAKTQALPTDVPSWTSPRTGDTGIYKELSRGPHEPERLFVYPDSQDSAYYRLTVQRLAQMVGSSAKPLQIEMDADLDGHPAPSLNTTAKQNAMVGTVHDAQHYGEQINQYVRKTATYDRRIQEVLVIASASMLNTTEGQLRIQEVDLYHALDPLRDVDVTFDGVCGRAWARFLGPMGPIARIQLWLEEMNNPLFGGATLLHEWGHYGLSATDEYIDDANHISQTIDANSAMARQTSTLEFCTQLNHVTTAPGGTIGTRSAWSFLQGAFHIVPPRPPTSPAMYPQNQATYFDVLHELQALLTIHHHRNPRPAGRGPIARCGAPGQGDQINGGYCLDNRECASDFCDHSVKKCTPNAGEGVPGEYCANNGQCRNSNCVANTCETSLGVGGLCQTNAGCKPGLACDANRRCSAGPNGAKDGEYCSNTNQCSTSSYCPSTFSVCKARNGIGGSCAGGGDRCMAGLGCDGGHRCFAGPNGAKDGEYCSNTNQCSTRSFCRSSDSTCKHKKSVPKSSLGSDSTYRCTSNEQCLSNYCDHPRVSRCYPAQNTGAKGYFCVNNANCLAGHPCVLKPGKTYGFCH